MYAVLGMLVIGLLAGCTAPEPSAVAALRVTALAGPTCPVVSDPPDPDCDDRPVEGAEVIIQDEAGVEVARVRTDTEGAAVVELPAGRYVLVPQPVGGLMGTAPPVTVDLVNGAEPGVVTVAYDTGIR